MQSSIGLRLQWVQKHTTQAEKVNDICSCSCTCRCTRIHNHHRTNDTQSLSNQKLTKHHTFHYKRRIFTNFHFQQICAARAVSLFSLFRGFMSPTRFTLTTLWTKRLCSLLFASFSRFSFVFGLIDGRTTECNCNDNINLIFTIVTQMHFS